MAFNSDDLGKIIIFLEKEKKNIIEGDGILRFETYPYNRGPKTDKQWIIIDLEKLKKQVQIRQYVSNVQIRIVLNGVELKDELVEPYKVNIEKLNVFFKKEWERRELAKIRDQF